MAPAGETDPEYPSTELHSDPSHPDFVQSAATAGGDPAVPGARRRHKGGVSWRLLQKDGPGRCWRGSHTPLPCALQVTHADLSKALWMSRLLPLLIIQVRLWNPNGVTSSPKGRAWGAQGGVIVLSRRSSCIQHTPSSHQGLKLSFLGQLLSPSHNIPGIILALLGPERFCEVLAVARAGQPIW